MFGRKMKPVAVTEVVMATYFPKAGKTFNTRHSVTLLQNANGRRKAEGDSDACNHFPIAVWLAGGPLPENAVDISEVQK